MGTDENKSDLDDLVRQVKTAASPLRRYLNKLHAKFSGLDEGKVADYIPELAKADPNWFGISLATVNGQSFAVGDHEQSFTIQSCSKLFVYGLALEDHGREAVMSKVGVEPTGEPFNAIVLDEGTNRPYNPMVNAGAIATTALIKGEDAAERLNRTLEMFRRYVGKKVHIDAAVFTSERQTGHRNRAIAHLMLNFGMIPENVESVLDLYFQQCSLLVTTGDLAKMAATLANNGVNPFTGEQAVNSQYVKDILSVMYTCGMYDFAGEWAYSVGLPAKSGVSGCILAVVPNKLGIAVFSPLLDERGNGVRGIRVCQELSKVLGMHVFDGTNGNCDVDQLLERATKVI